MRSALALAVLSVLCFGATLVSALTRGESCHGAKDCDPPLSCLGTGKEKKCFMKKGRGMICGVDGRDPYWVCEDGLICDRICKKPVGRAGSCNGRSEGCIPPLSCVGRPGNKKCFMKKSLGEVCGKDPFWVCEDGLTCEDNKCKKTLVDVSGSCNFPGEVCIRPFSCIGNDGNKKCLERKTLGMPCGEGPFSVCERDLFCDGVCKDTVGKGKPCNSRNQICHPTLKCEGPPGKKICVIRRKGLGMMCNDDPLDPYWWCEEDLICADGVCKKPADEAESCDDPDTECVPPLQCVGRPGKKKCKKTRKKGQSCPDPFWVCEDKLVCDEDKICKKQVGVGGKCGSNFRICRPPLSCDSTPKGRKCIKRITEGNRCGKDPYWRCAEGLKCVHKICTPE